MTTLMRIGDDRIVNLDHMMAATYSVEKNGARLMLQFGIIDHAPDRNDRILAIELIGKQATRVWFELCDIVSYASNDMPNDGPIHP
jgi:hypothetical protein